jgi:4'-phosphopantetheinyl transferase
MALPSPCTGVALWRIALHGTPTDDEWADLPPSERARAERFAFAHLRHRHVKAHAALRRLLAQALGVAPAAVAWQVGAQGKPALADPRAPAFNLSHSGDVALVALSFEHEVGVDVEVLGPQRDVPGVSDLVFTPSERAWMRAGGTADLDRRFLQLWTRKEACIKAIGSGLSLPPGEFDAGPGGIAGTATPRWQGRDRPLQVMPLEAGDDVVAALAISIGPRGPDESPHSSR